MVTTFQSRHWAGDFGKAYTERNPQSAAEMDQAFDGLYGVSASTILMEFLGDLPRSMNVLEIGCNLGAQLEGLSKLGFEELTGVDISEFALKRASSRLPATRFCRASGLRLPFADGSFDLVYTMGVLIHIAPTDLPQILSEIARCSRSLIFGFEYFSESLTEIPYRGHNALMWKADYPALYQQAAGNLKLLKRKRYPYLDEPNVDEAYLLSKAG